MCIRDRPAAADGTGSWTPSDLLGQNAFTVVKNANITVNSNTAAIDISTNTPMLDFAGDLQITLLRIVGTLLGFAGSGNSPSSQLLWYIQHMSICGNIGSFGIAIDRDVCVFHYGKCVWKC